MSRRCPKPNAELSHPQGLAFKPGSNVKSKAIAVAHQCFQRYVPILAPLLLVKNQRSLSPLRVPHRDRLQLLGYANVCPMAAPSIRVMAGRR